MAADSGGADGNDLVDDFEQLLAEGDAVVLGTQPHWNL